METNLKFNSSICTSRKQSERLLALGLKKETADMMYLTDERVPEEYRHYDLVTEYYESCLEGMVHIPAWSLHRLMEIVMKGDNLGCITHNIHQNNISTYYELVIASIEHLIKIDEFNKEYQEK